MGRLGWAPRGLRLLSTGCLSRTWHVRLPAPQPHLNDGWAGEPGLEDVHPGVSSGPGGGGPSVLENHGGLFPERGAQAAGAAGRGEGAVAPQCWCSPQPRPPAVLAPPTALLPCQSRPGPRWTCGCEEAPEAQSGKRGCRLGDWEGGWRG